MGSGTALVYSFMSFLRRGSALKTMLEPGHVVTVEPGIYLEDWGGIRIEDSWS